MNLSIITVVRYCRVVILSIIHVFRFVVVEAVLYTNCVSELGNAIGQVRPSVCFYLLNQLTLTLIFFMRMGHDHIANRSKLRS